MGPLGAIGMHTLRIETERLTITVLDEGMSESIHLNSVDEDNRRFMPDEVFETIEEARERIVDLISCYDRDDAPLVYAISLKSGQQIGHVEAAPIDRGWEIGFHVGKCHTRKGYATEAVRAFLPAIMEHLGLPKIFGICHAGNAASRRVLEKCGFLLESTGTGLLHGETQQICRYKRIAL